MAGIYIEKFTLKN